MSRDAAYLLGVLVPALAAVLVGWLQAARQGQSAQAQQLTAVGDRLDKANARLDAVTERLDAVERREQLLTEYAHTLRRVLGDNEIAVPEPPAGLEL